MWDCVWLQASNSDLSSFSVLNQHSNAATTTMDAQDCGIIWILFCYRGKDAAGKNNSLQEHVNESVNRTRQVSAEAEGMIHLDAAHGHLLSVEHSRHHIPCIKPETSLYTG